MQRTASGPSPRSLAAAGVCAAKDYVTYLEGERCYLFFNSKSKHLGEWNDSPDDAAIAVAQDFRNLD